MGKYSIIEKAGTGETDRLMGDHKWENCFKKPLFFGERAMIDKSKKY